MPMPVSRTSSSAKDSTRRSEIKTWPSPDVNFTAFESRFQITCCKRAASPWTAVTEGSSESVSETPRALAAGRTTSIAAEIKTSRSTGCTSSFSLPPAIRETSTRSSISWDCALALRSTVSSACVEVSPSSRPLRNIVSQPSMAVSGVRNSCERVARNSSFKRFASSASLRAACSRVSSCSRSSSTPLRWRNWPIWLPMPRKVASKALSGSRISGLKNSMTPRNFSPDMIGKANAACSPSAAAACERGKFASATTSRIHAGRRLLQIRPGRPTPLAKVSSRVIFSKPPAAAPRDGQTFRQRRTWASSSRVHIPPTSHSKVRQILCRIRGTASSMAGDSAKILVTESDPPRCRPASFRSVTMAAKDSVVIARSAKYACR